MTGDSVGVAVGGAVPWHHECHTCGAALLYIVAPWSNGIPRGMFCPQSECPEWLQKRPFSAADEAAEKRTPTTALSAIPATVAYAIAVLARSHHSDTGELGELAREVWTWMRTEAEKSDAGSRKPG